MSTIVKLADISLTKLNNAEFTYFAGQIISYIDAATVEALHVDAATFAGFKGNHGKLVDIVAQSRAAEETAKIGEADKQEDNLLSFLFATVKGACSHPIAAKREAAQAVYAVMKPYQGVQVMKPYQGVQSLPQRQQVQTVDGLVLDLEKEATAAHLTTLGLASEVETLKSLNAEYGSLIASRADSQQANPVESAKPIRKEMYGQYDELVSTAWAFSVAVPSDALSGFVASVNKLIADTNTAYNQRMAQRKKEEEGTE